MRAGLAAVFALSLPCTALAAELLLPDGAQSLAVRDMPLGRYELPLGAVQNDTVPTEAHEGRILRQTWRIDGSHTVLQILAPLRQQLIDQDYAIRFECESHLCGGFDFRFGIDVVPAPDMTVNIGDFHFVSASHADGSVGSLLVSRSGNSVFLQLVTVSHSDAPAVTVRAAEVVPSVTVSAPDTPTTRPPLHRPDFGPTSLVNTLQSSGHMLLEGVDFRSGSTRLAQAQYDSLDQVAAFLTATPTARVLLVGHTDNVGSLTDNVDLSFKRANAVLALLVQTYNIDAARLEAAGAGYMAPLTTNASPEGRETNRRVEVVLLDD